MVGVYSNMRCRTHVSNLNHLQAVKLLHTESKQGLTLLYFVSGNRVCNLPVGASHVQGQSPAVQGKCPDSGMYVHTCMCVHVLCVSVCTCAV